MTETGPSNSDVPADIPYRLAWRSATVRAGVHRGRMNGAGGRFRDLAPLLAFPDPRRIDLSATIRDPAGALFVRRFSQPAAISVYALVDMSGSMGVTGASRRLEIAAQIVGALAASARRAGDAFGLIGFDGRVREDLNIAARRGRGGESEFPRLVAQAQAQGRGAAGVIEVAALLGARRKLIFLISDFYWTLAEIESAFEALASHDVVAIVLSDSRETANLPDFGLLSLHDAETGVRRIVLMRPSVRAKWRRAEQSRREALDKAAQRFGRLPFRIEDRIDWDRLADYLMGGAP